MSKSKKLSILFLLIFFSHFAVSYDLIELDIDLDYSDYYSPDAVNIIEALHRNITEKILHRGCLTGVFKIGEHNIITTPEGIVFMTSCRISRPICGVVRVEIGQTTYKLGCFSINLLERSRHYSFRGIQARPASSVVEQIDILEKSEPKFENISQQITPHVKKYINWESEFDEEQFFKNNSQASNNEKKDDKSAFSFSYNPKYGFVIDLESGQLTLTLVIYITITCVLVAIKISKILIVAIRQKLHNYDQLENSTVTAMDVPTRGENGESGGGAGSTETPMTLGTQASATSKETLWESKDKETKSVTARGATSTSKSKEKA